MFYEYLQIFEIQISTNAKRLIDKMLQDYQRKLYEYHGQTFIDFETQLKNFWNKKINQIEYSSSEEYIYEYFQI